MTVMRRSSASDSHRMANNSSETDLMHRHPMHCEYGPFAHFCHRYDCLFKDRAIDAGTRPLKPFPRFIRLGHPRAGGETRSMPQGGHATRVGMKKQGLLGTPDGQKLTRERELLDAVHTRVSHKEMAVGDCKSSWLLDRVRTSAVPDDRADHGSAGEKLHDIS
jgi:hypothetical protein